MTPEAMRRLADLQLEKQFGVSERAVKPQEMTVPERADAPNPPEYAGQETAQQQREAYPEVQTLEVDSWPTLVFEDALATARAQGWEIVEASRFEGSPGGDSSVELLETFE